MDNERERDIWTAVLILACVVVLFSVQGAVQAYAVLIGASLYLAWRNFNALARSFQVGIKRVEEILSALRADLSATQDKMQSLEDEMAKLRANGVKVQTVAAPAAAPRHSGRSLSAGMATVLLLLVALNFLFYFSFRSEVERLRGELQLKAAPGKIAAQFRGEPSSAAAAKIPLEDKASFALAVPSNSASNQAELMPIKPEADAAAGSGQTLALRCVADDCNF